MQNTALRSKAVFFRWTKDEIDPALRLVACETFDLAGALAVCAGLIRALQEVHARSELHQALCPANLDVHADGTVRLKNAASAPLGYMSPEQSGRMNRGVDYRSDYYSLGVLFYELMTGRLPFESGSTMEMVHSHIARQPAAPESLNPELPATVAAIIMKLLAKNAEDRYQTLEGLAADVQRCEAEWREDGAISRFRLAQQDICDRLLIPQKLYGRELETTQLQRAFDRIADGGTELLLVTGYSGIGKSSLVNEIHKRVMARDGYLISGKFDQLKRNIPYYAIAFAFRELVRQILTEDESRVAEWRARIQQAVGPNGQIIIDSIPEVEHIIGPQPAVPSAGPTESQNRFRYVIQNFVGVFARASHPLVLFLDDLQWADPASLKLIHLFMTGMTEPAFLLIGTYRDNEVGEGDPLTLTIADIKRFARVDTIEVHPLGEDSVTELVADALKAEPAEIASLAKLIYRKTMGNPFFVGQFMKTLHHERLLGFGAGRWNWDIQRIEALDMTDNVVDLLTRELGRLPHTTRHVLTLASCIGNRFDLRTLASVSQKTPDEAASLLAPAVQAGLVIAPGPGFSGVADVFPLYRFLHDRVQQAAYKELPERERKAAHLQTGRLLYESTPSAQREERLFDIVQHLNEGRELLESGAERLDLAQLNLRAARKGKSTFAYETVLKHAAAGLELLQQAGQAFSPLYFSLQLEQQEAYFLSRQFSELERLTDSMLAYVTDKYDRARVLDVLFQSYLYQDRHAEVLPLAIKALGTLGIAVPQKVSRMQIMLLVLRTRKLIGSRSTEEFLALPQQTDPVELLKQQILSRAVSASYVANPALFPALIFERLNISLEKGCATPTLPHSLAGYAMVLIQGFGAIRAGYELGHLVSALVKKHLATYQQNVYSVRDEYVVQALIFHWKQHLSTTVAPLADNYEAGLQIGEFEYGVYSLLTSLRIELILGRRLPDLLEKMRTALGKANNLKQKTSSDSISVTIGYVSALMGAAGADAGERAVAAGKPTRLTLVHWHLFEAAKAYLFFENEAALEHIRKTETYIGSAACMATLPVYHLYHSLCLLACFPAMAGRERRAALAKVRTLQGKLKLWARHAPMNNLHKWQLVEAERFRVLGKMGRAANFYDLAIQGATENGFLNDEALAYELAGKFYLELGEEMDARMHIEEAHDRYTTWGAYAKVDQLERTYPNLLSRSIDKKRAEFALEQTPPEQRLDISTIINASQTLSEEIQLDKLLEKLMRLLIENAGAQRGVLLLQKHGVLTIQARMDGDDIQVMQGMSATESADMSLAVVNYVKRTQEKTVLGDAGADSRFGSDPYIVRSRPKSLLCIPLKKQSELVGILYLENNLAADAFTPERTALLQVLSTQIAISLENASLYTELEQKIEMRTKALRQSNTELSETLDSLKKTQKQLVESEKLASLGQLVAGVAHEINTPVGVGVTAASTLAEETEKLESLYRSGAMKRSDLDNYMNAAATISKLLLSNMERAATLIQSFKEVAIDQTSEERRVFRLKSYIEDVLLNLTPILRKRSCDVTVECSDAIEIDSYPGALSQILTNFVMNTLLHAFDDSRPGRMSIVVQEPDPASIELRFSDDGKGIPEEHLSKIFDPFYTTMRGRGGSGLGLNIVHNLVTGSLQGRVSVESTVNVGTTFVLKFPRKPGRPAGQRPTVNA